MKVRNLRRQPMAALLFLSLTPLLISACVAAKPAPAGCSPLFEEAMVTEIYFGLSGPNGRAIPRKTGRLRQERCRRRLHRRITVIPAEGYCA